MIDTTYAAWRSTVGSEPNQIFHASLPFYALLETNPKPRQPDWVEIACYKRKNNGEGMLAYLSLVDAELERQSLNRGGRRYRIAPLEVIDPRPYLRQHDNWFTVYMVYGFAARGEQLMTDSKGGLQALSHVTHFRITPDIAQHFHLSFGERVIDWLETLHRVAEIPDYARMIEDLALSSPFEIERFAQDALRQVVAPVVGKNNISHCALYDTVEGRWCFAALKGLP